MHAAPYEQVKLDEAQRKRGGGEEYPKKPEAGDVEYWSKLSRR